MNWQRWIRPGLAVSFVLAALALALRGGAIVDDIGVRVQGRLNAQGLDWASAETSWRDVTIYGTAPSEAAQRRATEVAASVAGVRGTTDRSELLPLESPYQWSARRSGSRVELSGHAPSEGVRAALLAEARRYFPSGEISENLTLARGAPESYTAAVAFALDRLAGLNEGMVSLTDTTLIVTGTAVDAAALEAARRALAAALPAGLRLGPVEILPARAPRFVWSAAVNGQQVFLAGFIPNDAARDIVAGEVRGAFPELQVLDQTIVASGEPEGFLDAVAFAVDALTQLDEGGVTLDGLTLDVAGTAKTVDSYEALLASVSGALPSGMEMVAADVVPATVEDYAWHGMLTPAGIELDGFVRSMQDRQDLDDLARELFGSRQLVNRVRVARGGPAIDWIGAVNFAINELARLDEGSVSINVDSAYAIRGIARTSADYDAVTLVQAGALPASLTLSGIDVVPPPVEEPRFVAELSGNTVVLAGHVSDHDERRDLLMRAGRLFAGRSVTSDLIFASGAGEGFSDMARAGLVVLARMSGGRALLEGTTLVLDGFVRHASARTAVAEALAERTPAGFRVRNSVRVRQGLQPLTAKACSENLSKILKTGRLDFGDDGKMLLLESLDVLDRVADVLSRCPDALVEIGVHSDSDGSRNTNKRRTQTRADTLGELLVDFGIRRERLEAVGYGEAEPVADNSTAEGKSANRRIAFILSITEPVSDLKPPTPRVAEKLEVEPTSDASDVGASEVDQSDAAGRENDDESPARKSDTEPASESEKETNTAN